MVPSCGSTTPGRSPSRAVTLRPRTSNWSICELVIAADFSALAVCTVAPSAVTVTRSSTAPSSSTTLPKVSRSDDSSMTFCRSTDLNPGILTTAVLAGREAAENEIAGTGAKRGTLCAGADMLDTDRGAANGRATGIDDGADYRPVDVLTGRREKTDERYKCGKCDPAQHATHVTLQRGLLYCILQGQNECGVNRSA